MATIENLFVPLLPREITLLDSSPIQKPLGRFGCRNLFRHTPRDGRKQHVLRTLGLSVMVATLAVFVCFIGQFVTVNKGGYPMVAQLEGKQPSLVRDSGSRQTASSAGGASNKLHLALDNQSYARLVWLQGALKAASVGEVIRRAFNAYEIFEPEDVVNQEDGATDRTITPVPSAEVKDLYVSISDEIKKQLDDEKSAHGRAYKETTSRALSVLTQLVRERAKLVAATKKGDEHAQTHIDNQANISPILLATV